MTTNKLAEKLKQLKPEQVVVTIDGTNFLVVSPGRIAKNQLLAASQKGNKIDPVLMEANLLAECVRDPETGEKVMPDVNDWDLPSNVVAPLVAACIKVCGLDSDEVKQMGKDSGVSHT